MGHLTGQLSPEGEANQTLATWPSLPYHENLTGLCLTSRQGRST